jgi:hypothetical protein
VLGYAIEKLPSTKQKAKRRRKKCWLDFQEWPTNPLPPHEGHSSLMATVSKECGFSLGGMFRIYPTISNKLENRNQIAYRPIRISSVLLSEVIFEEIANS